MPGHDERARVCDVLRHSLRDCEQVIGALGFVDFVCAACGVPAPVHHPITYARLRGERVTLLRLAEVFECPRR